MQRDLVNQPGHRMLRLWYRNKPANSTERNAQCPWRLSYPSGHDEPRPSWTYHARSCKGVPMTTKFYTYHCKRVTTRCWKIWNGCTQQDYRDQIRFMTEHIPGLHVMTDIIVGFPTESDDQFLDTVSVLTSWEPESVNASKFWLTAYLTRAWNRCRPHCESTVETSARTVWNVPRRPATTVAKQERHCTVHGTKRCAGYWEDQYYRQVIMTRTRRRHGDCHREKSWHVRTVHLRV